MQRHTKRRRTLDSRAELPERLDRRAATEPPCHAPRPRLARLRKRNRFRGRGAVEASPTKPAVATQTRSADMREFPDVAGARSVTALARGAIVVVREAEAALFAAPAGARVGRGPPTRLKRPLVQRDRLWSAHRGLLVAWLDASHEPAWA